jgi:hypothetical protein
MSEQIRMFEPELPNWVEKVWCKIDPDKRRELIAILAEMGKSVLSANNDSIRKAEADES